MTGKRVVLAHPSLRTMNLITALALSLVKMAPFEQWQPYKDVI
tara:strand:- start:17733 stop:17861 length:129 start_codon:yes stop_codon:yes gene_type:complete